ncbi:MAG TPA: cobalamin biosynthesis protein [Microvirga sp.]
MIVAGIGFRRSADPGEIVALVERAVADCALTRGELRGLATLAALADAPAFREAARRLGLDALAVAERAVAEASEGIVTHSARSFSAHGVGSVAEAAALGAAGPGARLVLPRIASATATCALARGIGAPA